MVLATQWLLQQGRDGGWRRERSVLELVASTTLQISMLTIHVVPFRHQCYCKVTVCPGRKLNLESLAL